ncbi:hypothetical protein ACUSIJ_00030 [Pseudochelatococcus sp. B33]
MSEQVQPDDLDTLMQRIRADVEARKVKADAQAIGTNGLQILPPPIDSGRLQYTAAELLAFYDVVFLRAAHLAVLGREPRGEGAAKLLQQLRLGQISRVDVIDALRASDEAHVRGARISGLGRERFTDGIRRSLLGRKLAALLRISRNIPRLASYMKQVIARVDTTERKVLQLEAQLNEALAAREAAEAQLLERIETLSRRVVELEGRPDAAGHAGER